MTSRERRTLRRKLAKQACRPNTQSIEERAGYYLYDKPCKDARPFQDKRLCITHYKTVKLQDCDMTFLVSSKEDWVNEHRTSGAIPDSHAIRNDRTDYMSRRKQDRHKIITRIGK